MKPIHASIVKKMAELGHDQMKSKLVITQQQLMPFLKEVPDDAYEFVCLNSEGVLTIKVHRSGYAQAIRYGIFKAIDHVTQLQSLTVRFST